MSVQKSSGVQATLRRVIELGYYGSDVFDRVQNMYRRHRYMCCALQGACDSGAITEDECTGALDAVGAYVTDEYISLRQRLEHAGLVPHIDPDEFADTVGRQLYWDWDKRPSLD